MELLLRKDSVILAAVLTCLVLLIGISNHLHSPVLDEVGHLAAGCALLELGCTDLYVVNPPMVKTLAALPVVLSGPKYDWRAVDTRPGVRTEWEVGRWFMRANGFESFTYFAVARHALLPFFVIGAVVITAWSSRISGHASAVAAILLYGTSPEILAWTGTICPDSVAASIGVCALWNVRNCLTGCGQRDQICWDWIFRLIMAGVAVGIAILAKTSWLVAVPVVSLLLISQRSIGGIKSTVGFVAFCATILVTINIGYAFAGTCRPLGNIPFFSRILAGPDVEGRLRSRNLADFGNRFRDTAIGSIPVPLPESFVRGVDLQKYDFEEGKWSYLRGEHKFRGWWYWYIYALMVKTPVGTILLFFIACGWAVWRVEWRQLLARTMWVGRWKRTESAPSSGLSVTFSPESGEKGEPRVPVLHENLILLAPAVCLFVLVSSQTGFSRYLRYVLPCYPFVFIWMSQIFSEKAGLPAWLRKVCWGLLAWSVISSLSVFPHSMSYFNELAGGPENGPAHLIDASIDWGQDVLFLADWLRRHPEAKPLYLSLHVFFDPRIAGIDYEHPPVDPRYSHQREYLTSDQIGPKPGWYSISVHQLFSRNKEFAYLFDFEKVDMVGYSIYIYHLTQEDVDDWNRKHGFAVEAGGG